MNILIIGNGFDLAHGLKTTYDDFLLWAYENNEMGKYYGFDLNAYWKRQLKLEGIKTISIEDGEVATQSKLNIEIDDYAPDYAKTLFGKRNGSWIDLENNLDAVIKKHSANWFKRSSGFAYEEFRQLFDNFLIAKFEKYIVQVVNVTEIKPMLSVGNADLVLSYNYSNTFERIYKPQNPLAQLCYINGLANSDEPTPHIVFGCDCYSAEYPDLSWYDKTSQRHEKNSDCRYKDWLRWNEKNPLDIFIVGHSIGITDHAILKHFIMNGINKTSVYYHCLESKSKLIYNMIGMVGQEYMNTNRIEFLPISKLNIEKSNYAKKRDQPKRKRGVVSRGIQSDSW